MAKGKNIYAARRCTNCNIILQTIYFIKSKFKPADLEHKKYCPTCRKRVETKVKEIKKAN